jgi:small-conductance mechanosensitive channel
VDAQTWSYVALAGAIVLIALVAARLIDRAILRHLNLPPERLTRYRVLRRSITAIIVSLGVLSALLVIPEVRAVAGGLLASSAVLALVIGMAARSTLANFVAGLLIAFTQPLRLGDEVQVAGADGTVEEITLSYTTIRAASGARFFVPNEKLASDVIRNATIAASEHLAQVTVPVPLASDLDRVLAAVEDEAQSATGLKEKRVVATVTDFQTVGGPSAIVTVEAWVPRGRAAGVAAQLRLALQRRLRAEGVL